MAHNGAERIQQWSGIFLGALLAAFPNLALSQSPPAGGNCLVPLTPALAEIVSLLLEGNDQRICGVPEYSDRPASLKKIRSIGRYDRFSMETLATLRPSLVIASEGENAKAQLDRLSELKVPMLLVRTHNLKAIADGVLQIGAAIGKSEAADREARSFLRHLKNFESQASRFKNLKVFLQVSDAPLLGAGAGSFLHHALLAVGAGNLLGEMSAAYPQVSREWVISQKPDAILILAMNRDSRQSNRVAQNWRSVYPNRIAILHSDALMRPTPSILEGLRALQKALEGIAS